MDVPTPPLVPVQLPTVFGITDAPQSTARASRSRPTFPPLDDFPAGRLLAATVLALLLINALPRPNALSQTRSTIHLPFVQASGRPSPAPQPSAEPSPTAAAEPIRWVGEIGGANSAVAVVGQTAYLGEGHHVAVVDLSDPAQSKRVGQSGSFPGFVHDLVIADGRAFVAAGEGGLRILDLADSKAPREIGALDTPGDARAVVVAGRLAFLADGPGGLRVIDISDPAAPRQLAIHETIQHAKAVAIQDGVAYVAVADHLSAGLLVVDVSDPLRPRKLAAVGTPGEALGVATAGHHVYLADGRLGLLQLDITDPSQPSSPIRVIANRSVDAVVIHQGIAYLVPRLAPSLVRLDLSDPLAPIKLTDVATVGKVSDLTLVGGQLFVADTVAGLIRFSLGGTDGPERQGVLDIPSLWAHGVAVSGATAYVKDQTSLRVMDLSVPAAPREVGRLDGLEFMSGHVFVNGKYVYLPREHLGLEIVDVSEPAAPKSLGLTFDFGWVGSMVFSGTLAYATDFDSSFFHVLDLAQPQAPRELGRIQIPGAAYGVAVSGTTAFVTAVQLEDLMALDISDPTRLTAYERSAENVGLGRGLAVFRGFAHVADSNGNLRIIDVSRPARTRQVGQLPLLPGPREVVVQGSRAFLPSELNGLQIADITDPTSPRHVATLDTQGNATAVALAGGYAYVADGFGGLQIFQVGE